MEKAAVIDIGRKKQAGWVDLDEEEESLQTKFDGLLKDLNEGFASCLEESEDRRVFK